jgi:hypothetical protein
MRKVEVEKNPMQREVRLLAENVETMDLEVAWQQVPCVWYGTTKECKEAVLLPLCVRSCQERFNKFTFDASKHGTLRCILPLLQVVSFQSILLFLFDIDARMLSYFMEMNGTQYLHPDKNNPVMICIVRKLCEKGLLPVSRATLFLR